MKTPCNAKTISAMTIKKSIIIKDPSALASEYIQLAIRTDVGRADKILFSKYYLASCYLEVIPPGNSPRQESTAVRIHELFANELENNLASVAENKKNSIVELLARHLERLQVIGNDKLVSSPRISKAGNLHPVPNASDYTQHRNKSESNLRFFAEDIQNPVIIWVTGEDNSGWAYENNAVRLSKDLSDFDHYVNTKSIRRPLVSFFFDIKLFLRSNIRGAVNIVRVGGPNPINSLYGDDWNGAKGDFRNADLVIATNLNLKSRLSDLHDNVVLIQNALDLTQWSLVSNTRRATREKPVLGYSASTISKKEARLKGFDIVESIRERLGVEIIVAGKGISQIPHGSMVEEFYSKIDLLVHPAREGKEGCSNTIMESLASGVPVLTTRHSGFHAEQHSSAILIADENADSFIERINWFTRLNPRERACLSLNSRLYAEEHHDIKFASFILRDKILNLITAKASPKIAFVPFWGIGESTAATTRLRNLLPCRLLRARGYNCEVIEDTSSLTNYDIVIVSQLAREEVLLSLAPDKQLIIYDICDIYFDDDRLLGGVPADNSSRAMINLAHLVTTSTNGLAREVQNRYPKMPVEVLPDGIDYDLGLIDDHCILRGPDRDKGISEEAPDLGVFSICWFGNPGRGNLDCVASFLEYLVAHQDGIKLVIYASKANSTKWPMLQSFCKKWNLDNFIIELRSFDVTVLGHGESSPSKSINRLVTAVWCGVAPIVVSDGCYSEFLNRCDLNWLIAKSIPEFEYAIHRLRKPKTHQIIIEKLRTALKAEHADIHISENYARLLSKYDGLQFAQPRTRVLLVSHNLNIQEGAPNSLVDLSIGLNTIFKMATSLYSLFDGPLTQKLDSALISNSSYCKEHAVNVENLLKSEYENIINHFERFVENQRPDLIVFNTAKTLSLSEVPRQKKIPYICIIRESLEGSVRLDFGSNKINKLSHTSLENAAKIVFVSSATERLWRNSHNFIRNTTCIPNGIDSSCFNVSDASNKGVRTEFIPENSLTILSVGTVNKRKRQRDIVEALNLIKGQVKRSIILKLVGSLEDAYSNELRARSKSLFNNSSICVELIAPTNRIQDYYSDADIFVFSSENESYPRVIVEAMYFGLPIISSKAYGTEEQIRDQIDGLMYEPGKIFELARHMLTLITDHKARLRFKKASSDRFLGLTSRNSMISQYAALIARET